MTQELAVVEKRELPIKISSETMSKLALAGDVGGLNPQEKVQYYTALCQRVGLDPTTQPFKLMKLNGKEVFYLDRSGAQQLNRVHHISHAITSRDFVNGCYVVTARASIGERFTDSLGSVATDGLKGEAFANATMKAETKAKRRATLDLVGLGMLDEMEVETIPNAAKLEASAIRMPEQAQKPTQSKTTPEPPKNAPTANVAPPVAAKKADVLQKQATEATRSWFLNELVAYESDALLAYAREKNILLPNESFGEWPLRLVPTSKEALRDWMGKFEAWRDGSVAPAAKEEWRTFPMPFGKQAGTKLEDLEKKYLYGLWANYKVETEYNGNPKKPETIEKDKVFRSMLDDCGRHYEFTKNN